MTVRRLISRAPLETLIPVFEQIRRDASIPESFPDEVVAEAEAVAQLYRDNPSAELDHITGERTDLTDLRWVTLDPEGAKDLDQAMYLERDGDNILVHYAIADVPAHVRPDGAIAKEAMTRAETVYCPDIRVPLHPAAMSEGYASLLPGQRTKAVVWSFTITPEGEVLDPAVERAWVTSTAQYAYSTVHEHDPELVELLAAVGSARRRATRAAGAVTLPKPSQEVVEDESGLSLEFRAASGVEDDNSHLSLTTGMIAAGMMLEAGVGILRTMPPADAESIQRLQRQARALGIEWADGEEYADVLDRIDPTSARGAAFLVRATSLFRGAQWEPFDADSSEESLAVPEQTQHGALAMPYAHVTAPLRRLVDRFGLEVCLAHHAGRPVPEWVLDALPLLAEAMSSGVRRNNGVDRACVDAVEAAVLEPHIGSVFEGIGLDSKTVQLSDPAVVARCDGGVAAGKTQRVTLTSADVRKGPRFHVVGKD